MARVYGRRRKIGRDRRGNEKLNRDGAAGRLRAAQELGGRSGALAREEKPKGKTTRESPGDREVEGRQFGK